MADRRVQPYRQNGTNRNPGPALTAMLRGRSFQNTNPADMTRSVQKLIRAGRAERPARPARPARPSRPERPAR